MNAAFFEVHRGLEREGPGSEATTLAALALCGELPSKPRIVDMGCGPGAPTVTLAKALPGARVVGVDTHRPFLAALVGRAKAAGVGARVAVWHGSMLDYSPPAPVDLIWSEGAAYSVGVAVAAKRWHALAAPGARLALSELVWLSDDPPAAVRDVLQAEYPPMGDRATLRARLTGAGWHVIDDFALPASDWAAYYAPLRDRVAALRDRAADDAALAEALAATEAEADLYDRYGAHYGYAFAVARRGE